MIYGYDHTYNRVKKWDKNGNKVSLYPFGDYEIEGTANASGVLTTTTTQRVNTGVGGGQSASREFNGSGVLQNSIWHHTDHLTGSSIETNSAGVLIQTLDYNPFGSVRTNTKTTSYDNKKKYTGKELDGESGLMYYGARYYDAEIGRWMGVDPLLLRQKKNNSGKQRGVLDILINPQALNTYQYGLNNPVRYVDPDGEDVVTDSIRQFIITSALAYGIFDKNRVAQYLLFHSLQDNPSNISLGRNSLAVKEIKQSKEYKKEIYGKIAKEVQNGNMEGKFGVEFKSDRDLFMAFHNMSGSYSVIGTNKDGSLLVSVTLTDRWDFKYENYRTYLLDSFNNVAWALQYPGVVQNYDIEVNMTISVPAPSEDDGTDDNNMYAKLTTAQILEKSNNSTENNEL